MNLAVKRFLTTLLALALVFSMIPSVALAASGKKEPSCEPVSVAESVESATSDTLQENSWRYGAGERIYSSEGACTDEEVGVSAFSLTYNSSGYGVFDDFDRFSQGYYTGTDAARGIDVSEHNGTLKWSKIKSAGVDFAIIRCGYGSDYSNQDDKQWAYNVAQCMKRGIPFGVYLYSYATNTKQAKSEADHVLRLLKSAGVSPSKLAYPVYLDMEDYSTLEVDHAAIAKAFCSSIKAAGYEVGVYANLNWWNNYLTDSCFDGWNKWLAQYNASVGLQFKDFKDFEKSKGIWQFSDYGKMPGINGVRFDLNYSYYKKPSSAVATKPKKISGVSATNATTYKVKVKADALNIRTGAGTSYKKTGTLKRGSVQTIVSTKKGWGKLSSGKGWINLSYTKRTSTQPKVKVSWSKASGVSGYQVSSSASNSSTRIISTTSSKVSSKTFSATKGKTYYIKVRAYKTVNGKKTYGSWSSVKKYKQP